MTTTLAAAAPIVQAPLRETGCLGSGAAGRPPVLVLGLAEADGRPFESKAYTIVPASKIMDRLAAASIKRRMRPGEWGVLDSFKVRPHRWCARLFRSQQVSAARMRRLIVLRVGSTTGPRQSPSSGPIQAPMV